MKKYRLYFAKGSRLRQLDAETFLEVDGSTFNKEAEGVWVIGTVDGEMKKLFIPWHAIDVIEEVMG